VSRQRPALAGRRLRLACGRAVLDPGIRHEPTVAGQRSRVRHKGQQHVRVQHVDVHEGGPAIDGAVVALCRSLDQGLIISDAFADTCGALRARLGRYALRGVGPPQSLWTLDHNDSG